MDTLSLPSPDLAYPQCPARHAGPLGFLRKHLDGDYPLARTYWVHLYFGNRIVDFLSLGALETVANHSPARYGAVLTIVLVMLAYAVWIFLALGTWAAAGKHAGRGGSHGWATAARVALVFGVLAQLMSVPESVQAIRSAVAVLDSEQPGPRPAFYLSRDARTLTLYGGINDGVARQLDDALARSPKVTTLVLASGGGWTSEGRQIGNLVAARGLNTHVDTECSSACTLAFLAGKVRSASQGARLGFHRFGPGDRKANEEAARAAYARLHMQSDFITKVTNTAPENMWYPKPGELLDYKVLTQAPGQAVPAPGGALTTL
jgi:hypothetical protein